jgi:CDP-glucose 4,6-dehydratase
MVNLVIKEWGYGEWEDVSALAPDAPHEARGLQLDCTKAITQLGWQPILSLRESVQRTVAWYQQYYSGSRFDGCDFALREIESYTKLACSLNAPWAVFNLEDTLQLNSVL